MWTVDRYIPPTAGIEVPLPQVPHCLPHSGAEIILPRVADLSTDATAAITGPAGIGVHERPFPQPGGNSPAAALSTLLLHWDFHIAPALSELIFLLSLLCF